MSGVPPAPTASTRVLALLGDPVAHSLSPVFQNAAIGAARIDAVYVALRCSPATAPGLLDAIARAGGGGNVTVPHKAVVLDVLERATDAVRRTRACNSFWLEEGRVIGDNTDVAGFEAAARCLIGDPRGARVLLLGAGGAARAAATALVAAGAARIDVANRTRQRAVELSALVDPPSSTIRVVTGFDALRGERYDLVVNATRLGMNDADPEPCDLARLDRVGAVLDLVYHPHGTRWVDSAAALGVRAADGTEMLLRQGAASFERWFGVPAPLGVMRAALRA